MKNLLIYINPEKRFVGENDDRIKIQIDNSLDLGWKHEDIILVTNFKYEYNGVKSIIVDDSYYRDFDNKSGKISVILYLLKENIVREGELWWFHDLDAYQVYPITKEEVDLGETLAGFTDYGWKDYWNTGSIFFKKGSNKIFEWMENVFDQKKINEEPALMYLTKKNYKNINSMYKKVNTTYNLAASESGHRNLHITTEKATKPIKVIHFGPIVYKDINYLDINRGNNRLKICLISDRLLKIFKKHLPQLCTNL